MHEQRDLQRRVVAARVLRGLSQAELTEAGVQYGHGKQELGRAERGEIELTEPRMRSIAEILELPDVWFDAPSIDDLLSELSRSDIEARLNQILAYLTTKTLADEQQAERIDDFERRLARQLLADER